ncbi:N-acetylneuraminate synthase [Geitlerinema sp. CS-897]|nr:N-acetylneuraminate synthase [Geitlerinema sp. CS-897]
MSTFIIAEAGVNHNGNLRLAKQLIDVAAKASADAVKFQTFRADRIISHYAPKAEYQTQTTDEAESQLEMVQRLQLNESDHQILIEYCHKRDIQFLSTPFDLESIELLTERFDLPRLKLPSGEITNAPLLLKAAQTQKDIILSTGMSTLGEVEAALGVLAFGYVKPEASPSILGFQEAYCSESGQQALQEKVTLLHCTTEYPAPFTDVNLLAMDTLRVAFGLPVGYSDHTEGIHISLAAVARGAKVIEKHFTLDRNLPGPDHRASLEPEELRKLVRQVREIEQAFGDGVKCPTASEWKNRSVARKSLVATREIRTGETFTDYNVSCKRPGTGVSPFQYWQTLDRVATRNFERDEILDV